MSDQDIHKIRGIIWISFWILLLGFTVYLFQSWIDKERNPNSNPLTSSTGDVRQVVLKRNRQGHYVTTGYINGSQLEFLLDTGATDISIPQHIADKLGLKKLYPIEIYTANGIAKAFGTKIKSATIGKIVLRDLNANINPNVDDDTILLGMNFLKRIEFTQRGDTLILKQYR